MATEIQTSTRALPADRIAATRNFLKAAFAAVAAAFLTVAGSAGTGCAIKTGSAACGDGTYCPEGYRCIATPLGYRCVGELCGNGIEDGEEQCDDGANNSDTEPNACRTSCLRAHCGDGVLDDGETCDDGNYINEDDCPSGEGGSCQPSFCGDGFVNPLTGETCDDGNRNNNDGCPDNPDGQPPGTCQPAACGDGFTWSDAGGPEQCDCGDATDTMPPGCTGPNADQDGRCHTDCMNPGCGDGVHDPSLQEQCDHGLLNSDTTPNACRENCQSPRCGDNVVDDAPEYGSEACDEGPDNSNIQPNTCRTDCSMPSCGDGIIDSLNNEECDDGDATDTNGCTNSCQVNTGWACVGELTSVCDTVCGDNIVIAGQEECDDGNQENDDYCVNCRNAVCGDGYVNAFGGEDCDDGNTDPGDGCSPTCKFEECGDGWVDTDNGEECDDGNGNNNDDCPDGILGSCLPAFCGDGFLKTTVDSTEVCDDANQSDGDGCDGNCQVETGWTCTAGDPAICTPTCGDGLRLGGEWCDDGNLLNGDGCDATCIVEPGYVCAGEVGYTSICAADCGDGVIVAGVEQCDDGDATSGDGCSNNCNVELGFDCTGEPSECTAICGDGLRVGGEWCDDGNLLNSDGCDATCIIEPGYVCAGELGQTSICAADCGDGVIVAGVEQCDDGDATSGDGCSNNCQVEFGYTCTGTPSHCDAQCGDGLKAASEECDDGDATDNNGCTNSCHVEFGYICTGTAPSNCQTSCGDGLKAATEDCDDGDNDDDDGCSAICTVELGWTCTGNSPSVCDAASCGDGVNKGKEECDDGNQTDGDGCSAVCEVETGYRCVDSLPPPVSHCEAVCGDGIVVVGVEQCDDHNLVTGDGCNALCQVEPGWDCTTTGPSDCTATLCGDGITAGTETCDDGVLNGTPPNCNATCDGITPWCGDGIKNGPDACDGTDFGGATCASLAPPADSGSLTCDGNCNVVTTGCYESCTDPLDCSIVGQTCDAGQCLPADGDDCANALAAGAGLNSGDTRNLTNTYAVGTGCGEIPHAATDGPDQVWSVSLTSGQYLVVTLDATDWDGLVYLSSDCPNIQTTCQAGWDRAWEAGASERLDYAAQANETVYLVVDGAAAGDGGPYGLNIAIGGSLNDADTAGQVIFSEIMPNPAGSHYLCQWFELFNTTSGPLNLQDLEITDGALTFTINYPLIITGQGYLLMATTAEPARNCGLAGVDWTYDAVDLDPAGPYTLKLQTSGGAVVLDQITYDATWPYAAGGSAYLCPDRLDSVSNDDATNWSQGLTPYGDLTNRGTPDATGPACP